MRSDKVEVKESTWSENYKNYNNQWNFFLRLITFSLPIFYYLEYNYQAIEI